MKGLNAKAQAMTLLKMACTAGASSEALALISAASITREGENAVDWTAVAQQLKHLVATLPTAVAGGESGLVVEEDEIDEEDELAA